VNAYCWLDYVNVKHLKRIAEKMAFFHRMSIKCKPKEPEYFRRLWVWYDAVKNIVFDDAKLQKQYKELNIPQLENDVLLCEIF
jgi:hypothetical protein